MVYDRNQSLLTKRTRLCYTLHDKERNEIMYENKFNSKDVHSTKMLVMMAMFTALVCVFAYISIPLPIPGSPHITMQNFIILIIALLFPVKQSFMIIFAWFLLGLIGIPVFPAGVSGIGYITSPWGGYVTAFLLVAIFLPLLRGEKYNRIRFTAVSIAGILIMDTVGMIWLKTVGMEGYNSWRAVFMGGFLPFVPMDLVKAVVAAQIIPSLRRIL